MDKISTKKKMKVENPLLKKWSKLRSKAAKACAITPHRFTPRTQIAELFSTLSTTKPPIAAHVVQRFH